MNRVERERLRRALRSAYPWVDQTQWGPAAVEAGECDGCQAEARLVMTCGPSVGLYLGRRCASRAGADAWCAGHADDAGAAVAWLAGLPAEADVVARLWWVASGEVVLDERLVVTQMMNLSLPHG